MPKVVAVCASRSRKIPKRNIGVGFFERDYGLVGDANAGPGPTQVVLTGIESHEKLLRNAKVPLSQGALGENLLTQGLDVSALRLGTQLRIGDVVLEVSQLGLDFRDRQDLRSKGDLGGKVEDVVYCIVCQEGYIKAGDRIEILK